MIHSHPRSGNLGILLLACLAFILAGCGGGSDSRELTTTPGPVPVVVEFNPATNPITQLLAIYSDPSASSNPTSFRIAPAHSFLLNPAYIQIRAGTNVFLPSSSFSQMCPNPRAGNDRMGRPYLDIMGTTLDEKNWIRSYSHEWYLWYDEIIDIDPDSVADKLAYFELMKTFALVDAGAEKDNFHFTIPTEEWLDSNEGIVAGYGAEFEILSRTPPREIRVAYVESGSPADEAGLRRGTQIISVNGVDVARSSNTSAINAAIFPRSGSRHTFVVRDWGATTNKTVTMTAGNVTSNAVHTVKTLETDNGQVGYLLYNGFVRASEKPLIDAFTQLRSANVTDLVLDLRYNGGGSLYLASELAYMVAGDKTAGVTFSRSIHNDKQSRFNENLGFFSTAYGQEGFTGTPRAPLPSLGLNRLFVLTGHNTCSASESVINGLIGLDNFDLILIGDTTCGKPYAFYVQENCGTSYFTIAVESQNDDGLGDYYFGFTPMNQPSSIFDLLQFRAAGIRVAGCFVTDDFSQELGDPGEGRLRAALAYRANNGTCPTVTTSASQARVSLDGRFTGMTLWSPRELLQRNQFMDMNQLDR